MSITLGPNRYGKAETRVVRVTKNGNKHDLRDLNVSVALSGDMEDVHLTGDNGAVLPTDTQKNTVFAFAKQYGIASPEEFGLRLARHFVDSQPTIDHARVEIEEYAWERNVVGLNAHPHSFVRSGRETRTARIHYDGNKAWVVSGLKDLTVLNSTGSEFHGYIRDQYTTLRETRDRVLATEVEAQWRHSGDTAEWDKSYEIVRRCLLQAFADTHSLSLQQTLYAMGERVLETVSDIVEVKLALPNKHHFEVDLTPFGQVNDNEVFWAADRPYGLIEGTVVRSVPTAGPAWD
ncbi:urate oxidase [Nocardia otitidiscaviarum]|uniref:Uricase n=1 Tax=Nocardia otitidiscaviarum TaxID=1823 RepID=A0A378YT33_9NOCA|nr:MULTISPECIES: urate oxidase [Nocardia]MBF6138216.1 urate oxidase [Nocardia otitidiscaviarum]MBF6181410.1 urate oxidase [Nocardia otitidiscaviarum]MBF6241824.1 urate oxidase [Nocardia otitidiscaviarum]MBF6489167.1 urate oxidase [Nocardia otitidiscaviarum]MCP9624190.1 urate oxidase [Nocardia otitidiscaviarum]